MYAEECAYLSLYNKFILSLGILSILLTAFLSPMTVSVGGTATCIVPPVVGQICRFSIGLDRRLARITRRPRESLLWDPFWAGSIVPLVETHKLSVYPD